MEEFFSKEKKKEYLRHLALAGIILAAFLFQNTKGLFPHPFGIYAVLAVPFTVCTAMFERELWGMLHGLFFGALMDAFSPNTVVFNAVFFSAAGFAAGILISNVFRNNIKSALFFCAPTAFLYNILYFLIFILKSAAGSAGMVFTNTYVMSSIYTCVLIVPVYVAVRAVFKRMSR